PGYGVSVQSPVTVSGRITGVDENIQVQVHQPSSQSPLGSSCCQSAGGSYVPWSAAVSFAGASDPVLTIAAATGGHVVAVERFAVTGVHAIPGTGSSAPPNGYPASFVGVRDNRIAVFASSDGQLQHYLTVPVAGGTASDPQLTDNAYWVYYIQSQGGCATTLMKVAYTGGNPVTVAAPTATAIIGFGTARGEQRLAYIAQACGGAAQDLVAIDTTTGATNRILTPGAPPGFASDPTWAPDGQHLAVIVRTGTAQHLAVYDAFTAHTVGDEQAATPCGQESPGSQLSHPVFDTAGSLLVAIASGGPGSVGSCAGGHLTTLFSLANAGAIAGLDATPDGSAILVSAFPATGGTAQVSRWVAGALSALPGASGSAWASW
ncbi:MAG TPA: hypothetical protein VNE21_00960, partial [Mycobacteriales bacterium]|nr:hypothetical protein [Mycobacteriales bacterium]